MESQNNNNKIYRYLGLAAGLIITALLVVWLFVSGSSSAKKDKVYSDYVNYFKSNQVQEYVLDLGKNKLTLTFRENYRTDTNKDGKIDEKDVVSYTVPDVKLFLADIEPYVQKNQVKHDYIPQSTLPWFVSLLPSVLVLVVMIAMWLMIRRSFSSMDGMKGMGFGKARVKQPQDEKRKTTFADVAGADEEKEDMQEIVDFLRSPKKFKELGARVPKGVLLVGPPGTGKTLLARAVAGEAGVPFFSISGSDFVEMYVGVGASRVRDLFDQAKKNSPCIIFIDEIDAVGRQRGAGLGGGHDEREQTLNQLLVEMDGFGANEGVIMIAATNRPDILDPALTRPGRFDRQIVVNYPDVKGREAILRVHAKGKPLAPDVDLSVIARSTVGFTGADLENLLNESALLAARKSLHSITMPEIEEATMKVVMGTEKRSHKMTEHEKKLTAYHEAGHAVVTYLCPTQDPVHQISIIPRGMAGGYTMSLPENDHPYNGRKKMLEYLQVCMGGRVAEALEMGDISTGASGDIEQATKMAHEMVTLYGMSDELGPVKYGSSDSGEVFLGRDLGHTRDYSEEVSAKIDKEVHRFITDAYEKTTEKLKSHLEQLKTVADYLLVHEKIDGNQFTALMNGEAVPDYSDTSIFDGKEAVPEN